MVRIDKPDLSEVIEREEYNTALFTSLLEDEFKKHDKIDLDIPRNLELMRIYKTLVGVVQSGKQASLQSNEIREPHFIGKSWFGNLGIASSRYLVHLVFDGSKNDFFIELGSDPGFPLDHLKEELRTNIEKGFERLKKDWRKGPKKVVYTKGYTEISGERNVFGNVDGDTREFILQRDELDYLAQGSRQDFEMMMASVKGGKGAGRIDPEAGKTIKNILDANPNFSPEEIVGRIRQIMTGDGYDIPPPPPPRDNGTAIYRKVLKDALRDGRITEDEGTILARLRNQYGITWEEHERIRRSLEEGGIKWA